ncbi:universal stress protein [Streptomyces sp. NPDC059680]|uniref:universal stress protein n=1 Tax=Streptomyces TaxID=1883 RepID=UPI001E3E3BD2|nr:universal stress protein [Streptomyces barringtoniae]MCC5476923.1 universal stress protein [Streptomyces barringtoniae]
MSEYRPPSAARVVVGVSGSLGGATALGRAAYEAGSRGAELWPVLAWEPPEGDALARRFPSSAPMAEEWERLACERLVRALREVFGSTDTGLPGQALVVRGAPGPALVRTADRHDDLLVVGAGQRGRLRRALWPSVGRHCLAHAMCPVLAVPPSPLQAELAAVHRRNAWGLRLNTGHLERELHMVPPES